MASSNIISSLHSIGSKEAELLETRLTLTKLVQGVGLAYQDAMAAIKAMSAS